MDLTSLIADVLEYQGFVVDRESIPMKARKGEEEYSVIIIRNDEELRAFRHMEISGKILLISLKKDMESFGDIFIDRDTLEKMVGEHILSKLTGRRISRGGIIASFEDAFTEHREPIASEDPSLDLKELMEGAFSRSKELSPFYAYYFSVNDGENSETGIILLNAANGRIYRARAPIVCDAGELSTVPRKEPSISDDESAAMVRDFLVKEHTREEEVLKEDGAVTVMEKRLIGIGEEDVELRYLGMLYIPMLRIETTDGMVQVDLSGITGIGPNPEDTEGVDEE